MAEDEYPRRADYNGWPNNVTNPNGKPRNGAVNPWLACLLGLITLNIALGVFFVTTAYRWERKMAVADRIMAAQRERMIRASGKGNCDEVLKLVSMGAALAQDDLIPSSMTQAERVKALSDACSAVIDGATK